MRPFIQKKMLIYNEKLGYVISTLINHSGIQAGFGTRFFETNSLSDNFSTYQFKQIHSSTVSMIDEETPLLIPDSDARITDKKNRCLIIRTSDCVPIIYADHRNGIIAISHNVWKGTLLNLSAKIIDQMLSCGASLQRICVAIGPSIGPCCYRIFGERYKMFAQTYPELIKKVCVTGDSNKGLNLGLLNYYLFLKAGVLKENIDYRCYCTSCDESRFYSYNRDRSTKSMYSFVLKYDHNR